VDGWAGLHVSCRLLHPNQGRPPRAEPTALRTTTRTSRTYDDPLMRELTVDHIGVAVPSLDQALPTWQRLTGGQATDRQNVPGQAVEVVFVGTGPARIELIAPIGPDSPLHRFLERRGAGLHHVCYRVPDIRAALSELAGAGFDAIDREPRAGAGGHLVAFLHPRTAGGVLVELVEHPDST
jgi:methylmalonyl-CoA/ethylmalonyl-CoA epimerase